MRFLHRWFLATCRVLLVTAASATFSACAARAAERFSFNQEVRTRQHLVLVALGREPADLIIRGAKVLNVFTLEWEAEQDIVIKGRRIAWVGPRGTWPGECATIIDATGECAVPGFGESHKHIESSHLTPEFEAALVLPDGNTWTVECTHEFANADGPGNVDFWMKAQNAGSPLKIFVALSSATPPTAFELGGGYYGHREITAMMQKDLRVIGLDEVMDWPAVWNPDNPGYDRMWQVIQATWEARGVVEGHGSGLFEFNAINAFAAAGLSSDHSVRLAQEGWDKMRRGVFIQAVPRMMPVFFPLCVQRGLKDWSNIGLTTDDRDAHASLQLGTMDYNVRVAIESGAPVEAAYAMASYYPARHWHVEHLVGSIAPGRFADVVLLKDEPAKVKVGRVFANGRLVAEGDRYLLTPPKIDYTRWSANAMRVGRALTAENFKIAAPAGRTTSATAAVLEPMYFEPEFMTATLPVADGAVQRDAAQSITKVAVVDRYHGHGVSKMFWKNVGPLDPESAVACSYMHDIHNIWVVGSGDAAMALAANKVAEMGGGWALVKEGRVVATVRYDIAGMVTARPPQELAGELETLYNAADAMRWIGQPGLPKQMMIAFLTCTPWKWVLVAPTPEDPVGFVNVTNGQRSPVVW